MMSHVLTTSTNGDSLRCGKYRFDTLPQPITPTRIFLPLLDDGESVSEVAAAADFAMPPNVSAAPPTKARSKNSRRSIPPAYIAMSLTDSAKICTNSALHQSDERYPDYLAEVRFVPTLWYKSPLPV